MNARTDQLGNSYTCSHKNSIGLLDQATEAYLASRTTTMPLLDSILAEDPDMPMALCFRGYLLKLAADPKFRPVQQRVLSQLDGLRPAMNDREILHLSALEALINNQMTHSVEILETLLEKYPRDILALRIAHYLHFYVGTDADMKASVSRAFDIWQPGDPYYGFILGMYSFGCEEAGDYATAETCGRQAVEINRDDIWAAHSVAHVLQMQSRFREGISWCGDLLPGWTDANNFVNHLHWHKALQHIGAGEPEAALNIYDTWLEKPIADDFYLDVCNAAALLWRLEMLGLDVGNRWEAQREISARRACDDDLVFPTMHYLMAPIALGDEVAVDAALASLQHWASENTTQGEICQQVGLPLAEAMIEVRSGNRTEGATRIAAIADDIWKIGGSHAQRDLFSLIQNYYH